MTEPKNPVREAHARLAAFRDRSAAAPSEGARAAPIEAASKAARYAELAKTNPVAAANFRMQHRAAIAAEERVADAAAPEPPPDAA